MQLQDSADVHQVMNLYSPLVYRLAYARTGNHSDAEDICQEVFLSLARKNPDFPDEEARKAWLIRVTINHAVSLWRTAWRRHVVLSSDPQNQSRECEGSGDAALADALTALPRDQRIPVHLYYFEGFRTDEIADLLGRRPATVRTQLRRARIRLKELLTEEVQE